MPGVGGDTLVRCFGTAHPNSKSVVLLHSSLPEEALRTKASTSGAHGYIRKSNSVSGLVKEVSEWLRRASMKERADSASSTSSSSSEMMGAAASSGGFQASASVSSDYQSPISVDSQGVPSQSGARINRTPVVLLVDTDMLVLSSFRRGLQQESMTFEFALSLGHAARMLLSSDPPDVVVSNIQLGESSGRELLDRAMEADPGWVSRFVFFCDRDDGEAMRRFGSRIASPVLRTPLDMNEVGRSIRACLRQPGVRRVAS
jgi:DNA-binding NarL/FixJ family response regulator